VLIADDQGRYLAANDRACALTGYSRAELLQKSIAGLTAPNEMARYERLWDAFMGSTKQYGVYNLVRKDGTLVKGRYVSFTNRAPGTHISFIVETVCPGATSRRAFGRDSALDGRARGLFRLRIGEPRCRRRLELDDPRTEHVRRHKRMRVARFTSGQLVDAV